MGMLAAALLQGASQGMNVLGQGMQRDLDRQDEQAVWEKRNRLLAEIQRENAKTLRQDQYADDDARAPTLLKRRQDEAKAMATTAAEIDLERATNPALQEAQEAMLRRTEELKLQLKSDAAKDPRTRQMIQQELEDLEAKVKIEGNERIRVANATRAPREGAKSISDVLSEKEKALGRTLTQQEREALVLGAKGGDGDRALRIKQAEEVATKAIELGNLKPEDRAKFVRAQLDSYGEFEAVSQAQEMLRTARGSGTMDEFIAARRRGGANDAALLQLGVTKDELKAAAPAKENTKKRDGMLPPGFTSPSQSAREEYLRELKILEDMKGSMFMPKARGNEREIAAQDAKVSRLLRAVQ